VDATRSGSGKGNCLDQMHSEYERGKTRIREYRTIKERGVPLSGKNCHLNSVPLFLEVMRAKEFRGRYQRWDVGSG